MNNLTPYEKYQLNESSEYGPMGFVLSFTVGSSEMAMSYTVAGIYDTFYDFAQAVNEDLGYGYDADNEQMEFNDVISLMDRLFEAMEVREGDYSFHHGFKIKSGAVEGYHSQSNSNCYDVVDMLEKLFVTPRKIIASKSKNLYNENDMTYIARSVERDPDKLSLYDGDDEQYNKILKLLNWDKKKLDAIIRVNRIKNQF
jgi:hypothetical protein